MHALETRESAIALYRTLKNGPAVGLRLGIAATTVYRILEAAGEPRVGVSPVPSYRPERKFTPQQETEIAGRYAAGERTNAIRKDYRCSVALVREIARRHGAEVFGRGNRARVFTDDEIALVQRLHGQDASQHEISKHLRCSQIAVSRLMATLGIKPAHNVGRGSHHGSWKGGRVVDAYGYVQVRVSAGDPLASMRNRTGYVREHRLVLARQLGRVLHKSESVHHIDGNRQNNAPANLELRRGPHGSGIVMQCACCGSRNIVPAPLSAAVAESA